jgi:hypothetical protein
MGKLYKFADSTTVQDLNEFYCFSPCDELSFLGGDRQCVDSFGNELWVINNKYVQRVVSLEEENRPDKWSSDQEDLAKWFINDDSDEWVEKLLPKWRGFF